jgi:HlyD family secretion protein
MIAVVVVVGAFGFLWLQFGSITRRDNQKQLITATGVIEATEVDVAAEIGGKIVQLPVEEGDRLKTGAVIATLDTSQLEAEKQRAEATLASARSLLQDLQAGARAQELERARARVNLARAKLNLDEANWRRTNDLFQQGVVSQNQLDAAVANRDVSREQHAVAVEELKLLEAGARPDRIEAAQADVKQAEAAVALTKVRLEKSVISSPLNGTVLVKDVEEGEVIVPGIPIVTVADLDDMWVKIYIDELDIGKIRLGQEAVVRVDAFPSRYFSGHVTYISEEAEFTPKNIQTREDRVKLVIAVKIGIDNAGGLLKPGMYADIELKALSPPSGPEGQNI